MKIQPSAADFSTIDNIAGAGSPVSFPANLAPANSFDYAKAPAPARMPAFSSDSYSNLSYQKADRFAFSDSHTPLALNDAWLKPSGAAPVKESAQEKYLTHLMEQKWYNSPSLWVGVASVVAGLYGAQKGLRESKKESSRARAHASAEADKSRAHSASEAAAARAFAASEGDKNRNQGGDAVDTSGFDNVFA
jgi:hypothetical protein